MLNIKVMLAGMVLLIGACSVEATDHESLAENELYHMSENLDLWHYAKKRKIRDVELERKVGESILKTIIDIKILNPKIELLKKRSLLILNQVITEHNDIFNSAKQPDLSELATSYLLGIRPDIDKALQARNNEIEDAIIQLRNH